MSNPSNEQFQDLDVCGNLVTRILDVSERTNLGSSSTSFHYVQGTFFATGNNQFTQGATYSGNTVFQNRATIKDLTLQNDFVAQGNAVYQGTLQAEQELKAIGHTVSIGSDQDNQTRLFVKTIQS